jgi:hypothetical protein
MGVPAAEVGHTPAMPRREDHEVHKGHVVALGENIYIYIHIFIYTCTDVLGKIAFFFVAQQPPMGQGLLTLEYSRSHSDTIGTT